LLAGKKCLTKGNGEVGKKTPTARGTSKGGFLGEEGKLVREKKKGFKKKETVSWWNTVLRRRVPGKDIKEARKRKSRGPSVRAVKSLGAKRKGKEKGLRALIRRKKRELAQIRA